MIYGQMMFDIALCIIAVRCIMLIVHWMRTGYKGVRNAGDRWIKRRFGE